MFSFDDDFIPRTVLNPSSRRQERKVNNFIGSWRETLFVFCRMEGMSWAGVSNQRWEWEWEPEKDKDAFPTFFLVLLTCFSIVFLLDSDLLLLLKLSSELLFPVRNYFGGK